MAGAAVAPEVTIWTDVDRAPVVASLLTVMGAAVKPIGVGGPRAAEVDILAAALDCPRYDDLRRLVLDRPAAYLLLTTMDRVGIEELRAAAGQSTIVLTMEPVATDLPQLASLHPRGDRGTRGPAGGSARVGLGHRIVQVPALPHCPGYLSAADPQEILGDGRLISLDSCGRYTDGSLFARLLDGWRTVLGFTELAQTIDASLTGPRLEAPDDLRQLTGRLAAHGRVDGGCSVAMVLSDRAAVTKRCLHVIGDQAELRVTDTSYDLRRGDGEPVDCNNLPPDPPAALPAAPGQGGFVDLIAAQWRRLLDRPNLTPPDADPQNGTEALACCLACLLSARTGQPESPRKILEMNE